ncbi:MAG: phosphocholine cytidylyltransferase family protein [Rhodospirillales bacterium]
MKAIILAAGRGSRMKKLTDESPKCLVKLRGKTLLDWQLDAFKNAGISQIAIVTGYKRQLLANRGLEEFYNARWAETNMVSSLACANAWLMEGPCIVSYSDIFYCIRAVTLLMEKPMPLAITYDPNWLALWTRRFGNPLLDAETFRLNLDNTVSEIGNKPKSVEEIQGQYMGLLRFEPEGWMEVLRICTALTSVESDRIHMTWVLQKIIESGKVSINAISYNGQWGEVDSV